MEKVASTRAFYQCLPLAEFVGFLVLDSILNWANRLHKLSHRFFTDSSRTHAGVHLKKKKNTSNEAEEEQEMLRREDVEIVMERMGLLSSHGSDKLKDCMGLDELSTVFEEEEPSLQEVNEAFSVFDENNDGFIDALELQTVLCKLGFREGADLDACRQMIETYDEDKDGKIDFNEFVRFMESCSC